MVSQKRRRRTKPPMRGRIHGRTLVPLLLVATLLAAALSGCSNPATSDATDTPDTDEAPAESQVDTELFVKPLYTDDTIPDAVADAVTLPDGLLVEADDSADGTYAAVRVDTTDHTAVLQTLADQAEQGGWRIVERSVGGTTLAGFVAIAGDTTLTVTATSDAAGVLVVARIDR
jgi:hypothetical protein